MLATVYGRYHYLADVVAAVAVSGVAVLAVERLAIRLPRLASFPSPQR